MNSNNSDSYFLENQNKICQKFRKINSNNLVNECKTKILNSPKSSNSFNSLKSNKIECRYCLCEETKENYIQPCNCEGSLKYVHNSCLGEWIKSSKKKYDIVYENEVAYYTSLCEICKYEMKYQINFENNFFISFYYTLKNTLLNIKSFFFLLLHSLVIFYFFNRLTFLVYHIIYVFSKNFKTKYLMRFVNEIAIFSTILWYTNDIIKYYGNIFFEQRKSLLVFKEKKIEDKLKRQFKIEMTLETNEKKNYTNKDEFYYKINNDFKNKNIDSNINKYLSCRDSIFIDNCNNFCNLDKNINENFSKNSIENQKEYNKEKNYKNIFNNEENKIFSNHNLNNSNNNIIDNFSENETDQKNTVFYEFELK